MRLPRPILQRESKHIVSSIRANKKDPLPRKTWTSERKLLLPRRWAKELFGLKFRIRVDHRSKVSSDVSAKDNTDWCLRGDAPREAPRDTLAPCCHTKISAGSSTWRRKWPENTRGDHAEGRRGLSAQDHP